jgi:copper chaperone CopZ
MKTTVIDVRDLLSPLSALGVEKQLAKLPGIMQIDVNSVSGSATVLYDEAVVEFSTIRAKVHECGHHCGGELVPRHVCEPETCFRNSMLRWLAPKKKARNGGLPLRDKCCRCSSREEENEHL